MFERDRYFENQLDFELLRITIPYHYLTNFKPWQSLQLVKENRQRKLVGKQLISRLIRMKIIPRVIKRIKLCSILGIPQNSIKIDNFIKDPTRANPLVDSLPRLLSQRVRVRLDSIIRGTKGSDSRCEHWDAKCMDSCYDLLVGLDDAVTSEGLVCGRRVGCTNVVHSFKYHGEFDTRLREDVAVDSSKGVRAEPVVEDTVSSCCLVNHGDV